MWVHYLTTAILASAWAFILTDGLRRGKVRDLPLPYLYTATSALALTIKLPAYRFFDPLAYSYVYLVAELPAHIAVILYLLTIKRLAKGSKWLTLVALVLPAYYAVSSFSLASSPIYRVMNVLIVLWFALGSAALIAILNNPTLAIGRTHFFILSGIYIPAVLVTTNHMVYLFAGEAGWWPFSFFGSLEMYAGILGWLLIAWGLRIMEAPRKLPRELPQSEVAAGLREVQSLLEKVR